MRGRREAAGEDVKREAKPIWAIATVDGILSNDFYIGTLRQGKTTRARINGHQVERPTDEILVFENHHQAILDYRTFATVRALREQRTTTHYRGVKKYDNVYTGFLECGDCGSPMFSMSRPDLKDAYRCGLYHRRGTKACTSHHIRVETLDRLVKEYVKKVMETSSAMLKKLNADMEQEADDIAETQRAAENLEQLLAELQEELKVTKRQRIRDIMKHPEREQLLEETYDEMEAELEGKITGLQHQIELTADKRNTIIRVNRAAKLAMDVFADLLNKEKLDRNDLQVVIEKIRVFEGRIEVQLKSDVDSLLRCGQFDPAVQLVEDALHHVERSFRVNAVTSGDPLEIYTEKDGEVIFKKYSPMGDLHEFAGKVCEALQKNTGFPAAVCDRDSVIAAAGAGRKELLDRRLSAAVIRSLEEREHYRFRGSGTPTAVCEGSTVPLGASVPILSEGDLLGGVLLMADSEHGRFPGDFEEKLIEIVAGFLGRQMEG